MKLDIEYSNNVESAINVLSNPDVVAFVKWYNVVCYFGDTYNDKKSLDLALKIYDVVGLTMFFDNKHTYKELEEFYEQIKPIDIDTYFPKFNASCLKDEPDEEEQEEEQEESEEDVEEQEDSSTFAKESISYDADITEDVKQRADVIKTSNAKRAALKKMKPNVK